MKHLQDFESFLNEGGPLIPKFLLQQLGRPKKFSDNDITELSDEFDAQPDPSVSPGMGYRVISKSGNEYAITSTDKGYFVYDKQTGTLTKCKSASDCIDYLSGKLNEAKEFDVIEWDEYVKPDYLMLSLSNGKKLRIDRKYVAGGKNAYFQIIDALEDMKRNPKAKAFIQDLVSKMAQNLK